MGSGFDLKVEGSVEPGFWGKTVPSIGGTVPEGAGEGEPGVVVAGPGEAGALVPATVVGVDGGESSSEQATPKSSRHGRVRSRSRFMHPR